MRKYFLILILVYTGINSHAQDPFRFEEEVQNITERNKNFNPENLILFTGSSSIRLWKDLQERFPEKNILNTGFGGSHTSDLIHYAEELIFTYKPSQIFIYEGDNDLSSDKTPHRVLKDTKNLVHLIQSKLPGTPIVFITPKPSIKRWDLRENYLEYIQLLGKYVKKTPHLSMINVWPVMLDSTQTPIKDIFLEDNLHLNKKGYDIWTKQIGPALL